ncbi:MAG: response regulator transcription factor [Anaerolineales bacterium]|nr:response regulator transcription factor [Anaerolineales bacterium]MCB9003948.1 response regulator transcription factor [Ardenticatenaceae bacterium]
MTTPSAPQARILIVDDEPSIRFTLERSLRREGYHLHAVASGQEALQALEHNQYDLLLLDLHLGQINGLQILEKVRELDNDAIVIILTGHSSLESAVEALRLGAFDYLFKPTMPDVIRQRVREGLLRRQQMQQRQLILQQIETLRLSLNSLEEVSKGGFMGDGNGRFLRNGPLVIDRQHRVASMHDHLLDLTTTEFDLLMCMVEAAPNPMQPKDLLRCALGYDADEVEARDTVKWHIHHLRRKIERDPRHPKHIKTVRYKGYFWSS